MSTILGSKVHPPSFAITLAKNTNYWQPNWWSGLLTHAILTLHWFCNLPTQECNHPAMAIISLAFFQIPLMRCGSFLLLRRNMNSPVPIEPKRLDSVYCCILSIYLIHRIGWLLNANINDDLYVGKDVYAVQSHRKVFFTHGESKDLMWIVIFAFRSRAAHLDRLSNGVCDVWSALLH